MRHVKYSLAIASLLMSLPALSDDCFSFDEARIGSDEAYTRSFLTPASQRRMIRRLSTISASSITRAPQSGRISRRPSAGSGSPRRAAILTLPIWSA